MSPSGAKKTKTRFAWLSATWFGCGYSPKAPGTVGSIAAILIAWPLVSLAGFRATHFLILSVVLLYPAIRAADIVAAESGLKDPQFIVIDEVLGQWITLVGLAAPRGGSHAGWLALLEALALFRLFDIWKPWPVRGIERLPGGTGIVLDDIMAGIYAALVLFLLGWFNLN